MPTTFSTAETHRRLRPRPRSDPGRSRCGERRHHRRYVHWRPRERLLTVEGGDGTVSDRLRFTRDEVSADFFKTLGTPLLRGRFFSIGDGPEAPRVAIVNEAMARRAWPGRDPVGRRLKLGREGFRPAVVYGRGRRGRHAAAGAGARADPADLRAARAESSPRRGPLHTNLVGRPARDGRGASSGRASRGEGCAGLWGDASGKAARRLSHAASLPDVAPDRLRRRGAADGRRRDLRAHPVLDRDAHTRNRLAHRRSAPRPATSSG